MDKPNHHTSQALFRFSVIAKVLTRIRIGESRSEVIRTVSREQHVASDGTFKTVRQRSLYRWLATYEANHIHGLEPKVRSQSDKSRVLSQQFFDFLKTEKDDDPAASVPELIRRARGRGILKQAEAVDRSTVYRACRRLGLSMARIRHAKDRDSRRFAHPHRMDMVLCDGKHFRVGSQRRKRVALFYIDDCSRRVLGVVVGTSETKQLFLRGLYECILRYGLMTTVFVDNGPGFIANDSLAVMARLKILLVHGERCYKEGHGKVERLNRTIKADVLRGLDGNPAVDPDCRALELRLTHYIEKIYAVRPHRGLGGDTPLRRFERDTKKLRFPANDRELRDGFEVHVERRVSNDHVISIDGIAYEVPRGYAGRKLTVRRRLLDGTIVLLHHDKLIVLYPVDLAKNARAKRAKDHKTPTREESTAPPITAAQTAYDSEFEPVVDADGGFQNDHSEDPIDTNETL